MKEISRKKKRIKVCFISIPAELRRVLGEFRVEVSVNVEFLRIYTGGAESTTLSVPVALRIQRENSFCLLWENIVGFISLCLSL